MDKLLTPTEVAAILGVNADTVRRMIRKGEIPASQINKRVIRVKQSDLEKIVKVQVGSQEEG